MQRENDFVAGLWRPARERLQAEIAASRAEFSRLYKEQPKQRRLTAPSFDNKGGKPLAEHWDAMWAEIATRLWNGNLQPKSQREIKDAMFAWLVRQEIDAGDTAVTQRARALWSRLQADAKSG